MSHDLEAELAAGMLQCLGKELAPSPEAIRGMIHEETRPLLEWLARALQTEEIVLIPEGEKQGTGSRSGALEDVLGTLSGVMDAEAPVEVLREDIQLLERQIAELSGPSGRLAQLTFRRERLAALAPTMARDGGSMKASERTTHQMCVTAAEELSGLCSELGYVLSDLEAHGIALASLHGTEDGSARNPPLLSRLSLENFIAQGVKHDEHVRKLLVLESAEEDAGEILWDGRKSSGLLEEHAWYSSELDRLKKVYALTEEDRMDAEVSLCQASAALKMVREQAQALNEGEYSAKQAAELERELMQLQQETISTELAWEDARNAVALPVIAELASMHGTQVLQVDAAANRARQERRMACQRQALHLLRLQAARLDLVELAMAAELSAHDMLAAVVAAVTCELHELAKAKQRVCSRAEHVLSRESGTQQGAAHPTVLSPSKLGASSQAAHHSQSLESLLPLHVALGGVEEGLSRAFLSLDVLTSEARALRESRGRAEAGLEAAIRAHEAETRALAAHTDAFQAVLWAKASGNEPVCTPAELEDALTRLEMVKMRLDASLDAVLKEREVVQSRAGRDRLLYADFFTRPDAFVESMMHLKREAGSVSSPHKASAST